MSQLLLPIPLGGKLKNRGQIDDGVTVYEAASGKQTRSTPWLTPRYAYTVTVDVVNSLTRLDYQALATFFQRVGGRLNNFLIEDPEDKTVTDHGFAVGDGTTAAFQLQRTVGGSIVDAAGVTYTQATKPYTNKVFNSSFETDSNADGQADGWGVYNNSSATEPTTSVIVPGLNGGKAQRISWGTNATNTKGVRTTTAPGYVAGQWYTLSCFVRASGSNIGKFIGLGFDSPAPNQTVVIACPALTANFQRYVFQIFWNLGTSPVSQLYLTITSSTTGGNSAANTFGDLDFDLVQVTTGQWGASDLQPIETPAASGATRNPAYWPALGDGYEPVTDLNGSPTIYQDGDWQGRRQLYPWARSNLLPFSQSFDDATWSKSNATVTANTTAAPDGTTTADTFNEGTAVTVNHSTQHATAPGETQGELRCFSVWLKAGTLPNVVLFSATSGEGISFDLSAGAVSGTASPGIGVALASGVQTSPLWPGWFRVWFVKRASATLGTGLVIAGAADATYNRTYTGTSRTFFLWGAMAERVSNLNGPTPYIPTPSTTAVTVTDYTLSSTGIVTPAAVLPAGAFLSADMAWYRRVRFADPALTFERIVLAMWSTGLNLVSEK